MLLRGGDCMFAPHFVEEFLKACAEQTAGDSKTCVQSAPMRDQLTAKAPQTAFSKPQILSSLGVFGALAVPYLDTHESAPNRSTTSPSIERA
jgi:hypothetical protein